MYLCLLYCAFVIIFLRLVSTFLLLYWFCCLLKDTSTLLFLYSRPFISSALWGPPLYKAWQKCWVSVDGSSEREMSRLIFKVGLNSMSYFCIHDSSFLLFFWIEIINSIQKNSRFVMSYRRPCTLPHILLSKKADISSAEQLPAVHRIIWRLSSARTRSQLARIRHLGFSWCGLVY